MEIRVETLDGSAVPNKSRSSDLKSLYRGGVLNDAENKKLKRKATGDGGDENIDKKKKNSEKEVSFSSLKKISSNGKRCFDSFSHRRLSPSKDLMLERDQSLNGNIGYNSISSLGNVLQVPRRKRGFLGRKIYESAQFSVEEGQSASTGDLVVKKRSESKEDEQVSHGNFSFKRSRRKQRGTKNFAPDSDDLVEEVEFLSDKRSTQEDEENLEENAAMMLSSRFDPNCTGYSLNNKASAQISADDLSFLLSSNQDFVRSSSKSISCSGSPSNDNAGRVLRPRIQRKENGHSRERRHFYEILIKDLDAYWVLNRRIKVFWPLDQSWYYGLVNDYDDERNLHHVKYDDRDEEWINLQNERFKLLLLPSEVPGKAECRKSRCRDKSSDQRKRSMKSRKEQEKRHLQTQDGSCIGSSHMDSEPIISWLARSAGKVKSHFHAFKKQKTFDLSKKPVLPQLSTDSVSFCSSFECGNFRRDKTRKPKSFNLTNEHSNDAMEDFASKHITYPNPNNSKVPIVYFRKRFRKTGRALSSTSEENHLCRSVFVPVTSFGPVDEIGDFEKQDVFVGRLDRGGPLWTVDDVSVLISMLLEIETGKFKFDVDFPLAPILYHSLGMENFWLFHAAMLLHYGAVMITWPQVHLEMLFVDNVVGLRFLSFEGCLKQALAFVFLVLGTFCQPIKHEKFGELLLPVTSIKFKLTCCQCLKKQLVFAFHNFSELENSKWMYLDWKLKRHCLLNEHLPLSNCTQNNIQMLESRANHSSLLQVQQRATLTMGSQERSRQGINFMTLSRESAFVDIMPNSDEMYEKLPTFFLSLHHKLLTEHSLAHLSPWENDVVEHLENSSSMMMDDRSSMEECLNKGSAFTLEDNTETLSTVVASGGCFSSVKQELSAGPSVCSIGDWSKSSQPYYNGDDNAAETIQRQPWQSHHLVPDQCALSCRTLFGQDSETSSEDFLNRVKIPSFNQLEKSHIGELLSAEQSTVLSWRANVAISPSPSSSPTVPRSTWHRKKHSSMSSLIGYPSHGWYDRKAGSLYNGFGNGPKKPRTQISYSFPFEGSEFSPKQRGIKKGLPSKRIRRANDKRSTNVFEGSQRNLDLLCSEVNILIIAGDRGWRESGAWVMLELFDHEWKLSVKVSGITKYTYKAHQVLQPGSTNRYTHAVMWKGGKDWILEFEDRSQWTLFKDIHEECYNRNIRAGMMKNIPIPGVRLIEEGDNNGAEIVFLRTSKYLRQVETDVEMALNPARVLYDMDSDDEQWILNNQNSSEFDETISEEVFEKIMDMFEKASYSHQDLLTLGEIEELMEGVGPMSIIKIIYDYWWLKRKKSEMPLIRHLQPPLWQRYQQEVREWELAVKKINSNLPNGCQDRAELIDRPPMFAFCMRPRGLEVPNKGSKQRSHKKLSVAGQSSATFGFQDGGRVGGFSLGDEKSAYPCHNYDSLDDSRFPLTSQIFLPRDAVTMSTMYNGLDKNSFKKPHRRMSKFASIVSLNDPQTMALYDHIMVKHIHGLHRWSPPHVYPERSERHINEQFDGPLDEFRLRDASGAAQHAINIAKLKRERAQRMVYRADVAIHKAVAALMIAEAMEECSGNADKEGR
ncbi:hypothetical protein G4B88_029622 [Cannabis sativa]|uniref:Enhancer of polycomb-like protein n=1 Tax=Cannabis sativa TaxID=3483 RepID=A0A7J6EFC0_CANSA|nr:hypothetical protein G4B88_029622 [Cannabis sativa]